MLTPDRARQITYRGFHHALVVEREEDFPLIRDWLAENAIGDYEFEVLEVPYTSSTFASVYIESVEDLFLFKIRWTPVE